MVCIDVFFPCKGAIAIAVANPTDLVKVRLQAEGKAGTPRRYDGAFDAYCTIVKQVIEDLRCTSNLLMHSHFTYFS